MITAAKIVAQIVAFLLTATTSEHTVPTECSSFQEIQYCYYQGSSQSQNIVYFMHGFGNDTRAWSWTPVSGKIEQYWAKSSSPKPHVVTVSFNNFWLYHEIKDAPQKLEAFTSWFEKAKMNHSVHKRYLYGDSMGGYNAIKWISDRPSFFNALTLICPAISKSMTDTPDSNYGGLKWLSPLADKLFFDPRVNSHKHMTAAVSQIIKENNLEFVYLAAIPTDELGFYPGNQYLKRQILGQGQERVIWHEHKSRHCNIDPTQLASLLLN